MRASSFWLGQDPNEASKEGDDITKVSFAPMILELIFIGHLGVSVVNLTQGFSMLDKFECFLIQAFTGCCPGATPTFAASALTGERLF